MLSITNLQLIIGSSTSLFRLSYPKYAKWILQGWLPSLWQFLSRVKFEVNITTQWLPIPQREQDVMLMDFFISLEYKPKELKLLNQCRIYLQAISLKYNTSADGRVIMHKYKVGILSLDRKSTYNWPIQQRPSKEAWRLWQTALQHLERNNNLVKPLGNWLTTPHQS
jgi:hypothetical protein